MYTSTADRPYDRSYDHHECHFVVMAKYNDDDDRYDLTSGARVNRFQLAVACYNLAYFPYAPSHAMEQDVSIMVTLPPAAVAVLQLRKSLSRWIWMMYQHHEYSIKVH